MNKHSICLLYQRLLKMLVFEGSFDACVKLFDQHHQLNQVQSQHSRSDISHRYLNESNLFLENTSNNDHIPVLNDLPEPVRTIARQLLSVFNRSKQICNSLERDILFAQRTTKEFYSNNCLFIALSFVGRFNSTRVTWAFG